MSPLDCQTSTLWQLLPALLEAVASSTRLKLTMQAEGVGVGGGSVWLRCLFGYTLTCSLCSQNGTECGMQPGKL